MRDALGNCRRSFASHCLNYEIANIHLPLERASNLKFVTFCLIVFLVTIIIRSGRHLHRVIF